MDKIALQATVVDRFYSREGYLVQFDSFRWVLSKDITIPVGSISKYLTDKDYSFRRVLEFYVRTGRRHMQRMFFIIFCITARKCKVLSYFPLPR